MSELQDAVSSTTMRTKDSPGTRYAPSPRSDRSECARAARTISPFIRSRLGLMSAPRVADVQLRRTSSASAASHTVAFVPFPSAAADDDDDFALSAS